MTVKDVPVIKLAGEKAEPFIDSRQQLLAGLAYVDLRVRWAVARARAHGLDPEDEFRGLYISEEQIDNLLGYELGSLWPHANGQMAGMEGWHPLLAEARSQWQARCDAADHLLLTNLIQTFELSPAEADILLVSLAPELDPRYERLFAYLQDDVTKKRPSVDLVLNLLTDSFDQKLHMRRLISDDSRLVRSQLIVRYADGGGREPSLLSQYLRPAARVVEHLLDQPGLDEQLKNSAELYYPVQEGLWLEPELLKQISATLKMEPETGLYPMFCFQGGYGVGKLAAAEFAASRLGKPLLKIDLDMLTGGEIGLIGGLHLALRDARLLGALVYLTGWDSVLSDERPPANVIDPLLAFPGPVITAGVLTWQPAGHQRERRILRLSFGNSDHDQRVRIWQFYLGDKVPADDGANLGMWQLANQFLFSPGQIEDVVATALDLAAWRNKPLDIHDLFAASRAHSNQKLVALATKITPRYRWEDIVLPADTLAQLREMVNTVRQKPQVYDTWGFNRKVALGKGLSALFAGESGTGKTMAADIMAGVLGQDLYKIDLSMMVSKYIGETEKNLNRVFSEAETSNAILFFDEADAIFGKRSEVKDSHDRYANIEVSYLLQRMESYDGVVILASNLRGNLDEAFTRRLHFIIEFPFPEASDREVIWRVNFPEETPLGDDVDFKLLARRFRIAGGNIRNIIMASAFLAAEDGQPVSMKHLLHGSRREYQKIGRLIDEELFVLNI